MSTPISYRNLCTVITLFITVCVCAQKSTLYTIVELHKNYEYEKSTALLNTIDTLSFNATDKANYYYEKARNIINNNGDIITAYKLLLKSKRRVLTDSLNLRFKINDELIYTYNSAIENNITPQRLIEENCKIAQETQVPIQRITCNYYQLNNEDEKSLKKSLKLLHESLQITKKHNLDITKIGVLHNIGAYHNLAFQPDSALIYFNEVLNIEQHTNEDLSVTYNNMGRSYYLKKDYAKAIQFYEKSLKNSQGANNLSHVAYIQKNLAEAYFLYSDFEKSASYYDSYTRLTDSLNSAKNMRALEELEIKYQTTEKEKENALLEAQNLQKQQMLIILSGSALVLLILGSFYLNNQHKKQRIATQQKEIEKERANNILKNQELATIDAMITGQEKERKKIAEELHDNLGSTLTTVRLYFENLKETWSKDGSSIAIDKTQVLLDEAYEKIRSMSHTRHHGILASKGLIPTLETLAAKITDSGQITVDVVHHGLDQKLEASLELTLFRIIQELLSNVVKHAHATHASVNLTAYDDFLNIIVEDNGVGFDTKNLPKKEGMGLSSIEIRVEKLNGSFEADSFPNHGSTINIDIPL